MPKINMKEAWKKLRAGDPTTDAELKALHAQVTMAIGYFNDRGIEMHLAFVESVRIKSEIEGYMAARGYNVTFDPDLQEIVIGEKRHNAGF